MKHIGYLVWNIKNPDETTLEPVSGSLTEADKKNGYRSRKLWVDDEEPVDE